jgi:hypothetical protein
VASDGRYTVIVTVGAAVADWASGLEPEEETARIEKRPMWLVFHTAEKEPSGPTVADTVGAQVQPVWCPERSISIVWPAMLCGAVPVKVMLLRRIAEAVVLSETPLPVAETVKLPLWTEALDVPDELVPVDGVGEPTGDPPGLSPDPPDDAVAAAGRARAAHMRAHAA